MIENETTSNLIIIQTLTFVQHFLSFCVTSTYPMVAIGCEFMDHIGYNGLLTNNATHA